MSGEIEVATRILRWLVSLKTPYKRFILLIADAILIALSFLLAMLLRLDSLSFLRVPQFWLLLALAIPISLAIFVRFGFYREVLRYITSQAFLDIALGVLASSVILLFAGWIMDSSIPRSVPVIYAFLALVSIGGLRFTMREVLLGIGRREKIRIIIYGAGASGRQLLLSLLNGAEYLPVAFVDDNSELHKRYMGGCPVYAPAALSKIIDLYSAKRLLLAMPSLTRSERSSVLRRLEGLPIYIQTVPGIADLVSGRTQISEVSEVSIEDLLGRDVVLATEALLERNILGRVVLVTGAGGSIGSQLCRQIVAQAPSKLILLDLAEFNLYSIDQELQSLMRRQSEFVEIIPILGSVNNSGLIAATLKHYGVQTVFHAAAYKHVPLVEGNVIEGVRNNVFGTRTLAEEAVEAGVSAFILVSTDKAVRPTNVMGASKRIAEQICQVLAGSQSVTRFAIVRFGNVLGSSGSVIPLFRRQIAGGGPITVTHPEVTRFFMTISEAAQLVIQAGAMAKGGDVFVLDMGEPIRIKDMAMRMAKLSGLRPVVLSNALGAVVAKEGDEIGICFTGLRPGEKLYEELLISENVTGTEHPRIMVASEPSVPRDELEALLEQLMQACNDQDALAVRRLLGKAGIGFVNQPSCERAVSGA